MFCFNVPRGKFLLILLVLLLIWLTWQNHEEFTKYGGIDEFTFHPGEKKVSATKLWQSFTPRSPPGFCNLRFLPSSPISLYFIYNPQDTPPKASQTIFHLSSHQVVINQLLLYLLLSIPWSGGSLLLYHACLVPSLPPWLAFKSFSLHHRPIFSPVGWKKKKYKVKKNSMNCTMVNIFARRDQEWVINENRGKIVTNAGYVFLFFAVESLPSLELRIIISLFLKRPGRSPGPEFDKVLRTEAGIKELFLSQ